MQKRVTIHQPSVQTGSREPMEVVAGGDKIDHVPALLTSAARPLKPGGPGRDGIYRRMPEPWRENPEDLVTGALLPLGSVGPSVFGLRD